MAMVEPTITHLAKKLAEDNNVAWQHLDGTGDEGNITEKDVLLYLASLIQGDIPLPAEPLTRKQNSNLVEPQTSAHPELSREAISLAEQNGIFWQNLRGSGEDGSLQEADLVAYMSEVMAHTDRALRGDDEATDFIAREIVREHLSEEHWLSAIQPKPIEAPLLSTSSSSKDSRGLQRFWPYILIGTLLGIILTLLSR